MKEQNEATKRKVLKGELLTEKAFEKQKKEIKVKWKNLTNTPQRSGISPHFFPLPLLHAHEHKAETVPLPVRQGLPRAKQLSRSG